jgi:hypothetical protein
LADCVDDRNLHIEQIGGERHAGRREAETDASRRRASESSGSKEHDVADETEYGDRNPGHDRIARVLNGVATASRAGDRGAGVSRVHEVGGNPSAD